MAKRSITDDVLVTEEVENIVAEEEYSVIETKIAKEDLESDGWVQETKEPFVDVDGKSKLLFHKKQFYKYLEVES